MKIDACWWIARVKIEHGAVITTRSFLGRLWGDGFGDGTEDYKRNFIAQNEGRKVSILTWLYIHSLPQAKRQQPVIYR